MNAPAALLLLQVQLLLLPLHELHFVLVTLMIYSTRSIQLYQPVSNTTPCCRDTDALAETRWAQRYSLFAEFLGDAAPGLLLMAVLLSVSVRLVHL
jgi:hypothetical protein